MTQQEYIDFLTIVGIVIGVVVMVPAYYTLYKMKKSEKSSDK